MLQSQIQVGVRVRCTWQEADVHGKTGTIREVIPAGEDGADAVRCYISWDEERLNSSYRGTGMWWHPHALFELLDPAEEAKLLDMRRRHEHAMRYL